MFKVFILWLNATWLHSSNGYTVKCVPTMDHGCVGSGGGGGGCSKTGEGDPSINKRHKGKRV